VRRLPVVSELQLRHRPVVECHEHRSVMRERLRVALRCLADERGRTEAVSWKGVRSEQARIGGRGRCGGGEEKGWEKESEGSTIGAL